MPRKSQAQSLSPSESSCTHSPAVSSLATRESTLRPAFASCVATDSTVRYRSFSDGTQPSFADALNVSGTPRNWKEFLAFCHSFRRYHPLPLPVLVAFSATPTSDRLELPERFYLGSKSAVLPKTFPGVRSLCRLRPGGGSRGGGLHRPVGNETFCRRFAARCRGRKMQDESRGSHRAILAPGTRCKHSLQTVEQRDRGGSSGLARKLLAGFERHADC